MNRMHRRNRTIVLAGIVCAVAPESLGGTSDFNGDGRDELVIQVPYESVNGIDNAGALHVLRGSADGVTASGDQLWHQDVDGIPSAPAVDEFFAWAFATGDFDDDGRDDLAVCSWNEDLPGFDGAGAVHVLYGTNNGLSANGDQFWSRESNGVGGSAEANESFGTSLAVGDFDGDGFDDLAISAPFDDVAGVSSAGSVTVLYGSSSGLASNGDQRFSQATTGVNGDPGMFDEFGLVLAAGDFDGDGRDDLAIGVRNEDVDGVADAGAVNVLYGSNNGLTAIGDQVWSQNSSGVMDDCEVGDNFGYNLAAGDFDNDGRDDLAIGVIAEDIGLIDSAGAVNVLYGSSNGLTAAGDQLWHQDSAGINDSAEANDFFGLYLASGDFDGDGRDDLAIGAPSEDVDGMNSAGAVSIIFGSSSGLASGGDQFLHQNTPGIAGSATDQAGLGYGLFVGDFDGDGRDDLAVSIPSQAVNGQSEAGNVLVLYGSNSGISTNHDQLFNQETPGIAEHAEIFDNLGYGNPG